MVEEAPQAYKDVDAVVDVSHNLGIATKVAKLVPIGVIKGLSDEDSELERLKAKRLAEMQKNISSQQKIEETTRTVSEKSSENPRDFTS